MAMGVPGWPELAACTASMARVRMVLMAVCSILLVPATLPAWGAAWAGCAKVVIYAPFTSQLSTISDQHGGAAKQDEPQRCRDTEKRKTNPFFPLVHWFSSLCLCVSVSLCLCG